MRPSDFDFCDRTLESNSEEKNVFIVDKANFWILICNSQFSQPGWIVYPFLHPSPYLFRPLAFSLFHTIFIFLQSANIEMKFFETDLFENPLGIKDRNSHFFLLYFIGFPRLQCGTSLICVNVSATTKRVLTWSISYYYLVRKVWFSTFSRLFIPNKMN